MCGPSTRVYIHCVSDLKLYTPAHDFVVFFSDRIYVKKEIYNMHL